MTGSKTNSPTREHILAAVRNPPPQGDFVWDGADEDERPLSRSEMRAGIESARNRRDHPAEPDAELLDADVLEAFKASGEGWRSRLNEALREWLRAHPPVSA
jgi:uncharacterized protein (DUF4415 family)